MRHSSAYGAQIYFGDLTPYLTDVRGCSFKVDITVVFSSSVVPSWVEEPCLCIAVEDENPMSIAILLQHSVAWMYSVQVRITCSHKIKKRKKGK